MTSDNLSFKVPPRPYPWPTSGIWGRVGNRHTEGALYGGVAAVAAFVIPLATSDNTSEPAGVGTIGIIVGLPLAALSGALVGSLAGQFIPKYQRLYKLETGVTHE
jgi:hypothetical protein